MRLPVLPERFEQYDFISAYKTEQNPRKRIRLLGLSHLQEGKNFSEVGKLLKVGRQTVRSWLYRFMEGSFENLKDAERSGAKPHLLPEHELCFQQAVLELQQKRNGGSVSGEDIRELLATRFNAQYTLSGVYDVLKRLEMTWITCRSKHPKRNEKQQDDFKKNFAENAQSSLPAAVKPENVEVWFQDEARFGLRGTLSRIWAIQGSRPRIVRQQQSTSTYLFGAVCPQRDKAIGLVLPVANTQTMQIHLSEISKAVAAERHALLVCDMASWHTTDKLVIPENITLLSLPGYSPELNPTEQVWEVLRRNYLSNRCFANYEDLVDACCSAWNQFTEKAGAVSSLCFRRWAVLFNSS